MKGRRLSRGVRLAHVALWGLAAAHVLEAIWLRRRRHRVGVLNAPDQAKVTSDAVDVVTVGGAHVDDETLAAAAREMETTGLEMIDLVPGDLPTERALRLLRRMDVPQLGSNPFYAPGGAHEAIAFVTHDNMTTALEDEGFEVVATERGTVTPGLDLSMATLLGIQAATGNPHLPWLPTPSLTERAKRIAVIAAAVPVLIAARLVDDIKDARLGPDDIGGAYRIVARRPGGEVRPPPGASEPTPKTP